MDAQERVRERLQRSMEHLLREFAADGVQPVDCVFTVHMLDNGAVLLSGGEPPTIPAADFPVLVDLKPVDDADPPNPKIKRK